MLSQRLRMRTLLDQDTSHLPELWQSVCRHLEETMVAQQFRIWIQALSFISWSPEPHRGIARVSALNDFAAGWIRDNFQGKIEQAFEAVTGLPCVLEISVASAGADAEFVPATARRGSSSESPQQPEFEALTSAPAAQTTSPDERPRRVVTVPSGYEHGLDPRYTFESFVVGASNQFAHAFAVSVAEQPARKFNPLLIHSRPGLGKNPPSPCDRQPLFVEKPYRSRSLCVGRAICE